MKEVELNGRREKVASTVDSLGLFCPLPVVKLKLELERVESGGVVELLADDPGVMEDIPAWCRESGNTLLSLGDGGEGIFIAYVRKKGGVEA